MFGFNSTVGFSQVDADLKIRLKSIVDYFQDCANFQSASLGDDFTTLIDRGYAWILTSWQIVVDQYPKLYDDIRVNTWARGWKSFFGFRNFTIEDTNGNVLVHADSKWIYMDIHTLHPARITPEMAEFYPMDPPYPMEPAPKKIHVPAEAAAMDHYTVHGSDIDPNHHVNNGRYVSLAEEYLPEGFSPREMRVEYRNAATLGEVITPRVFCGDDTVVVSLDGDDETPFSVISFLR